MAKKKLTPEEVAAEAEKAKAAKPAAKSAKPSAQEMSGGAVKPAPKPDAAAKGAAAMDDFINPNAGTKAAGQTSAEAKAAFQETRAANQAAAAAQAEKRFTMVSPEEAASKATAAESGAAKMAAAAEGAAAKSPGMLARAGRAVVSPAFLAPLATSVADEGIPNGTGGYLVPPVPRADDATDAGYNINTARDAGVNAVNYGALTAIAKNALKLKNPYLIGGAALLGGGKALYDRLSNYHEAHPEADEQSYALPEAKPNFWEQAPAAVSDAGRVASQILRGVGDGTSYLLNNYTPYPYLKQANDAVASAAADYFTPESMKQPAQPEPQAPAQEPVQPPVNMEEGPLPANTERLSDGKYRQELYGPDGTYRGFAVGNQEQIDRLSRPSAEEVARSARRRVEEIVERNNIARRAQQEREFRERTSPEAAQRFFDRVNSERALRDAMNRGRSSDPARNALLIQDIQNAATNVAEATGKSIEEILPADSSSSNVRLAREILRTNPDMGLNEIGLQGLGMTPARPLNFSDDEVSYADEQAKTGGARLATAATASNRAETQQRLAEQAAQEADNAAARLQQAEERLKATAEGAAERQELSFRRAHLQSLKDLNALVAKSGDLELKMNPEEAAQHQQQIEAAQSALRALNEQAAAAGVDLGYVEPSSQPQASLANLQKLSAQDLEALSWANSNPDDPRSLDIKNKIQAKLGG